MKYQRDTPIGTHLIDGEPFFLLRAKDLLAIPTLVHYSRLANTNAPEVAAGVSAVTVEFAEWQARNPEHVRLPD